MRWIVTFMTFVIALSMRRAECSPWIQCDANVVCQESDRKQFAEKQVLYKLLMEANRLSSIGPFIERDSPIMQAIANRSKLCTEMNMVGFFANGDATESYPIACLWSGGDSSGTCSPAPPHSGNEEYGYIPAAVWASKIKEVRKSMGCSGQQIADSDRAGELYICRNRCVQLGLGDYNSAIASFAVTSSFIVIFMLT